MEEINIHTTMTVHNIALFCPHLTLLDTAESDIQRSIDGKQCEIRSL